MNIELLRLHDTGGFNKEQRSRSRRALRGLERLAVPANLRAR